MDKGAPAAAATSSKDTGRTLDREQVGSCVLRRPTDFAVTSLLAEFRSRMKTLHNKLDRAIYVIGNMYRYASNEERIEKVKKGIQRGDFTLLTDFIMELLTVYLVPAKMSFQEVEKAITEVRAASIKLATNCRIEAEEANSKREFATLVGETVGTGVGMAVSVVTGVGMVFDIAVGLGIACAAYSNHTTEESELRKNIQLLDKVVSSTSSILDFIYIIEGDLDFVSRNIDIINQTKEAHEVPSRLVSALDRLCQKIHSLDVSTYREQLRAMTEVSK